jgi:hypothetical protein
MPLDEQQVLASRHLRALGEVDYRRPPYPPLLALLVVLADRLSEREIRDLQPQHLEDFQWLADQDPQQALDCLHLLMEREDLPIPEHAPVLEDWAEDLILLCLVELNLYRII